MLFDELANNEGAELATGLVADKPVLGAVGKGLEKANPPGVAAGGLLVLVAAAEVEGAEKAKRFGANVDVEDAGAAAAVVAGVARVDIGPVAKLVNEGADALVPKLNKGLSVEMLVDAVVAAGALN